MWYELKDKIDGIYERQKISGMMVDKIFLRGGGGTLRRRVFLMIVSENFLPSSCLYSFKKVKFCFHSINQLYWFVKSKKITIVDYGWGSFTTISHGRPNSS